MRAATKRKPRADVYQFSELSESAKERARQWYRECLAQDQWWDGIFDDAKSMAELMGIEIADIYFQLYVQGAGACFTGSWAYQAGMGASIREAAPCDDELHEIAAILAGLQAVHGRMLSAKIEHRGHGYHDGCTFIEVFEGEDEAPCIDEHADKLVRDTLRRFMRWIYKQLETEDEYLTSDENIEEAIEANEYEFDEDGNRA